MQFIRRATDKLHARTLHGNHGKQRHLGFTQGRWAVKADEIVVRQGRAGRDHLGSTDDDPRVGFFFHLHVDIFHLVGGFGLIDRRVHQGVVEKQAALLGVAIPA